MRVPYYLLASALCCAIAIGACSDGPTNVADDASLSASDQSSAVAKGKKDKFDICHYDASLNEGAGTWVHLSVNGNAWDGDGPGCGGKENGHDKQTGHNGHEDDTNWNEDTLFVATECEMFCYEDRDGDGLTDDVDPCIFDADNDSDGDGVCLSDGDTCYADPGDSDGGSDTDGDGICDADGSIDDNCPDDPNTDQENVDGDDFGAACDCDDENPDVNPDATEVCNGVDDNCSGAVDDGGVCDAPEACNEPSVCLEFTEGCGDGDTCESHPDNPFPGTSYCFTEAAGGGVCLGDFECDSIVADECQTSADCGVDAVCIVSSCCEFNKCVTTDLACGTPDTEAGDIVPRLFKGQVRTGSGR